MRFFLWRARVACGYDGHVDAELHRRGTSRTITVARIRVSGDDFDQRLAEAIADARQRAITLNGGISHAARRLP